MRLFVIISLILLASCKSDRPRPIPVQPTGIVMMGDSITAGGDWNALLRRSDVSNMGVPSDTTQQMLARLGPALNLRPARVFILAGINDISHGLPADGIASRIFQMADAFAAGGATVTIQTTICVAADHPQSATWNAQVAELNQRLTDGRYAVLDLHPVLCRDGVLPPSYADTGGIHLTPPAYAVWAQLIATAL